MFVSIKSTGLSNDSSTCVSAAEFIIKSKSVSNLSHTSLVCNRSIIIGIFLELNLSIQDVCPKESNTTTS